MRNQLELVQEALELLGPICADAAACKFCRPVRARKDGPFRHAPGCRLKIFTRELEWMLVPQSPMRPR